MLVGLAVCLMAAAGCNIVAPAVMLAHGPEKAPRVHDLDPDSVTVVFIDDRQSRVPRRALRVAMAEKAEQTLLSSRTVNDMISGQAAMNAAANDRRGQAVPIAEIGRAVEAQTVIYVTVDQFTLTPDGQTYAPTARLRAKVIDVESASRIWPDDVAGHPVFVRAHVTSRDIPRSIAGQYQAQDELARLAGLHIARLFHDHERPRGARIPD